MALWVESVLATPALQHLLTQEQPEMEMPILSVSPTPGCQGSPHPTKDEKDNFLPISISGHWEYSEFVIAF